MTEELEPPTLDALKLLVEGLRSRAREIAHDLEGRSMHHGRGMEVLDLLGLVKDMEWPEKQRSEVFHVLEGINGFKTFLSTSARTLESEAKKARAVCQCLDDVLAKMDERASKAG